MVPSNKTCQRSISTLDYVYRRLLYWYTIIDQVAPIPDALSRPSFDLSLDLTIFSIL